MAATIKVTKNGNFLTNVTVNNKKKSLKFGPGRCCNGRCCLEDDSEACCVFRTHPQISITKPEILCELKVAFPNFALDIYSRVYLNDNILLKRQQHYVLKRGDSFTVENYKIEISWNQIKPQKTTGQNVRIEILERKRHQKKISPV